jgi:hypothetical protein
LSEPLTAGPGDVEWNFLGGALDNPNHVFKEAPFTRDVVKAMQQVS